MNFKSLALPLALALAAAGCASGGGKDMLAADAPRALPESGPVSVRWNDPATFTELRYSRNRWDAQRGDWVEDLAEHLRKQASKQLPEGQKLDVTITDIKRAGSFEPWHGANANNIRVMRDVYPPRMTLQVRITDADGKVVSEGEQRLVDTAFLMNSRPMDTDPLRFEKDMIDTWLRRELPAPPRA